MTWDEVAALIPPDEAEEWLEALYAAASMGTTVEELRRRLVIVPLREERSHMEGYSDAVRAVTERWGAMPRRARLRRAWSGRSPL